MPPVHEGLLWLYEGEDGQRRRFTGSLREKKQNENFEEEMVETFWTYFGARLGGGGWAAEGRGGEDGREGRAPLWAKTSESAGGGVYRWTVISKRIGPGCWIERSVIPWNGGGDIAPSP
jgi:hypothetical protein